MNRRGKGISRITPELSFYTIRQKFSEPLQNHIERYIFRRHFTRENILDISEIFHENTKIRRSTIRRGLLTVQAIQRNPELIKTLTRSFKNYRVKKIDLPIEWENSGIMVEEVIKKRRSCRNLINDPVDITLLSKLLYFGYGITDRITFGQDIVQELRAAPSAGALFPLEIYLVVNTVKGGGICPGVYHYDGRRHALDTLKIGDFRDKMYHFCNDQEFTKNAAAIFVIAAVFWRTKIKYGERGYRYVLLDAGHLAQNIWLVATSSNLGAVTIGGFLDDKVNELIGVDGVDEAALYLIAVGKPSLEGETVGREV